jgi:outer membrane protein assembly factor BamD
MKNIVNLLLALLVYFTALAPEAHAFWIWSRKEQAWRNPEMSALASPQAQLDKAIALYNEARYDVALKELRKVSARYADSVQAPEALYYTGLCWEALGRSPKAFLVYESVVKSYPRSTRIGDIFKRVHAIAEELSREESGTFLGVSVDDWREHPAIAMFTFVIENAPYSEEAQSSQYKLGMLYKQMGRNKEAIETFQDLIEKYADSPWREPAQYQLALSSAEAAPTAEYDQKLSLQAKEGLAALAEKHSDQELAQRARKELTQIELKEAEKDFGIARFYDRQGDTKSAAIYYRHVVDKYTGTDFARQAASRLAELETGT